MTTGTPASNTCLRFARSIGRWFLVKAALSRNARNCCANSGALKLSATAVENHHAISDWCAAGDADKRSAGDHLHILRGNRKDATDGHRRDDSHVHASHLSPASSTTGRRTRAVTWDPPSRFTLWRNKLRIRVASNDTIRACAIVCLIPTEW